ncbi:MAG: hypothetical protein II345_01465 [Alistipes sp.]|nr:hypothetical protein [Alistipes sp.]
MRFYRAIAEAGLTLLRAGGKLYFEIYHALADEMRLLIESLGYEEVRIITDLYNKPRMLCGRKPNR